MVWYADILTEYRIYQSSRQSKSDEAYVYPCAIEYIEDQINFNAKIVLVIIVWSLVGWT